MVNGRFYFMDFKRWEEEIKNGHPKSVYNIVKYLNERGSKIKCYKNIFKSEYILEINNFTCYCKNAREVMELLKGRFFAEKSAEEKEYWQKVVQKELQNG